jgi:hypothetical protein
MESRKSYSNVTVEERILQFPGEFCQVDGKLYCLSCQKTVAHAMKVVIENHLQSDKHRKKKLLGKTRIQQSINSQLDSTSFNKQTIDDFLEMLFVSNIPIEAVNKMRPWMEKYVKNVGAIPGSDTLRQHYTKQLWEKYDKKHIDCLKNMKFSISVDGTTDRCGRHLINTVIYPADSLIKPFLADCNFVENENNITISQSITKVVTKFTDNWNNLIAIITDNLEKNIIAVENLKRAFNGDIKHIRCSNHVINLFCEAAIKHPFFDPLHKLLSKLQKLFKKSPEKAASYARFQKYSQIEVKAFPDIIQIRWGNWIESVCYLSDYFNTLMEFLRKESFHGIMTKTENKIKNVLEEKFTTILIGISFTVDFLKPFVQTIKLFEGNDPLIHIAFREFSKIKTHFEALKNITPQILQKFNFRTNEVVDVYSLDLMEILDMYKEIAGVVLIKINSYISLDYFNFFEACRVFDPSQKSSCSKLMSDYVFHFKEFTESQALYKEMETYLASENVHYESEFDIEDFWENMSHSFPNLSCFVNVILTIPISQALVERSFSIYRKILTPECESLTTENVKMRTCIYFNSN